MHAKRLLSVLLALRLMVSVLPAALAAGEDIEGHWAQETLQAFLDAGYLKGDTQGNVLPNNPITRAEFAALINRICGFTDASDEIAAYTDVSEKAWYYNDLACALKAGYLKGSANQMEPNANITREQAFAVVARVIGLSSGDASALDKFSDADAVSKWARGDVAALVSAGFVSGNKNGTLNPKANMTRAEAATVLSAALLSKPEGDTIYGTASLTYAEFYAGDVTTTEGYDTVSSATNSKYAIMGNIYTDFVDADANADGYHILGVQNVYVAVASADYDAYIALNPTFKPVRTVPSQYKTVTIEDDKAVYSETKFNVADTVTDAAAVLKTTSNWGDYEIDVTDGAVTHLRNARTDEFDINSKIQGVILETAKGRKIGLEHLQSIWVQPYEVSFNVSAESTRNGHIAAWDNLDELKSLVGETIVSITYIMPDCVYVYQFDGIYIKPAYTSPVSGKLSEDGASFTLDAVPEDLEDASILVQYTVGSGRAAKRAALYSGPLAQTVALDLSGIAEAGEGGVYSATISSSNYADIAVAIPMTQAQKDALKDLIAQADAILAKGENGVLKAHREEAAALLANENATTAEANSLIAELTQLIASANGEGSGSQGGHGGHH